MVTHPRTSEVSPPPAKRRRWWLVGLAVVLGLGFYAVALRWVTGQVETDVLKSIRPLPVAMETSAGQPKPE